LNLRLSSSEDELSLFLRATLSDARAVMNECTWPVHVSSYSRHCSTKETLQLTLLDREWNRGEAVLATIIRTSSEWLGPVTAFLQRDLLKDCTKHLLGLLLVLHTDDGVDLDVVVAVCQLLILPAPPGGGGAYCMILARPSLALT
jgi:hypothetical protein